MTPRRIVSLAVGFGLLVLAQTGVANAAGYLALALAMTLPGPFAAGRWLTRLALVGFTSGTIGAWFLFGGRFPLAYLDFFRADYGWIVYFFAFIAEVVRLEAVSLGEEHVRLLSRFGDKVVLAFDSDEAGARAAERAFQFLEAYPLQPVVLILPSSKVDHIQVVEE